MITQFRANVGGAGPIGTQAISGSVVSSSVTLTGADVAATTLLISNSGTVAAFIRVGVGAQTATAADMPILGGQSMFIAKSVEENTVAGLTASSTATIYVTAGHGGL